MAQYMENESNASTCVKEIIGYQFEKLIMMAGEITRVVDAFLRE